MKFLSDELLHLSRKSARETARLDAPDISELNNTPWLLTVLNERRQYNPLTWALAISWAGPIRSDSLDVEYREALSRMPQRRLLGDFSGGARRTFAPDSLYEAFRVAATKAQAAALTGLSTWEVDRWLRLDAALGEHWRERSRTRRRDEAIAALQGFFRGVPTASRADARRALGSDYRWLENNEKNLLIGLLPPVRNHFPVQMSFPFAHS